MPIHTYTGATSGSFFDERLRLRKAERVFLQELEGEVDAMFPVSGARPLTGESNREASIGFQSLDIGYDEFNGASMLQTTASVLQTGLLSTFDDPMVFWEVDAQMQLDRIQNAQGEQLGDFLSTKRLDKIKPTSPENGDPKYARDAFKNPDIEPTRLTALSASRSSRPSTSTSRPSSSAGRFDIR